MESIVNESDIKSWLQVVLKDENLDNFTVKVLGNSEKGDGYIGDIVFVSLIPVNDNKRKTYNLVLKCSKQSQALREKTPVKQAFLNEMYIYNTVFPAFKQFQLDKGVTDVFNSAPKCYGTLETENMEIIVFENLKNLGYTLWNKKLPLTRKHIEMVLGEYAKFHAISIAMNDQRPKEFEELHNGLSDVFERFLESTDIIQFFGSTIDEIHELLRDELDVSILTKWKKLKENVNYIFHDMLEEMKGTKVILHGDCWSNNFMFKPSAEDELLPLNAAVLDWQISRYCSPVLDLSYFICASISKEDIDNLDDILKHYYESLSARVKKLGSNLDSIYPIEEFFQDWKKYCKYGVVLGSFLHKICATDKDEVIDIAESAEKGENFSKSFDYDVKDKTCFRNRSKHVVKYAVQNNLI